MVISFRPGRSGQTVQTQIRLLLEEQFDLGLHCLEEQFDLGLHCLEEQFDPGLHYTRMLVFSCRGSNYNWHNPQVNKVVTVYQYIGIYLPLRG